MAFFTKKNGGSKRRSGKVVATGKRMGGTWTMESNVKPSTRRGKRGDSILQTENRRVRTLH